MTTYRVDLDTPAREELGPAASPNDLGVLLAQALREAERKGLGRPRHTLVVDEGKREPTKDETDALEKALETAELELGGQQH